jgi:hypothetical protein
MSKAKYDSSVARMAGNIASGLVCKSEYAYACDERLAKDAVALARAIVAEVQRTEPAAIGDLCGNRVYPSLDAVALQNSNLKRPNIVGTCDRPLGHTGICLCSLSESR